MEKQYFSQEIDNHIYMDDNKYKKVYTINIIIKCSAVTIALLTTTNTITIISSEVEIY